MTATASSGSENPSLTLFDAIREHIDPTVDLLEMDGDINDEAFARALAEKLDEYMRASGVGP